MIIVMRSSATQADIDHVIDRIKELGFGVHLSQGEERTVIGAIGDERQKAQLHGLESAPGVERVVPILQPYKLVSREFKPESSTIFVRDIPIGGTGIVVIAGPCSVENRTRRFWPPDATPLMPITRPLVSLGPLADVGTDVGTTVGEIHWG